MNLEIRSIKDEEILETALIYIECWQNDYKGFIPDKMLNSFDSEKEAEECKEWLAEDESAQLFAAFLDNKMVGYIAFSNNVEKSLPYEIEINGFFVREEFRNLGIGLQLLQYTLDKLKTNKYSSVLVYNFRDSNSNSYYRRLNGKIIKQEVQRCLGKALDVDIFGWQINELSMTLTSKLGM